MKPTHKAFTFGLVLGTLGCWLALKGFVLPSIASGDAPVAPPAQGAK